MFGPKIYIIILNYNGWQDTVECLKSLFRVSGVNFEVVVVDNASLDGSFQKIVEWTQFYDIPLLKFYEPCEQLVEGAPKRKTTGMQRVILFYLSENIGFGAANNLGLRQAQVNGIPYAVILNNDTIVEPDFLFPLVEYAEANSSVGLLGCQIRYAQDRDKVWWAGGWFNFWLGHKGFYGEKSSAQVPSTPYRTEWVTGCMTFIPLSIFSQIGGYDEQHFILNEDCDLSLRVDRAGHKMVVVPSSMIYHKVGRSLGGISSLRYYYSARNLLLLRSHYLPRWKWICFFVLYMPYKFLQVAYYIIRFRRPLWPAYWDSIRDFVFKRFGQWRRHYE